MYIVIKERGEYSGFNYEIFGYYHNQEQAEYAVELLEYENSLQCELGKLRCNWVEQCNYIIETIPDGTNIINIHNEDALSSEKANILEKYTEDIELAKRRNKRLEEEKNEHNKKLKEARKVTVLEFWEWWNKGNEVDPYFNDKKQARIREILPIMKQFLYEDFHSREMSEWFNKYWNITKEVDDAVKNIIYTQRV